MSTYQVEVDFGSGWEDISTSLYGRLPVQRKRAIHSGLKPTIGKVDIKLVNDTTLMNRFVSAVSLLPVRIHRDTVDYFVGVIRPTHKIKVTATRPEWMDIEIVENWYRLEKQVTGDPFVMRGCDVSDPADKTNSILHQLFYEAGFADAELNLSAIAETVAVIAIDTFADSVPTYRQVIEKLLADSGYSVKQTTAGVIELYDLGPASITASVTLESGAGGNLTSGYEEERDEFSVEAVEVSYYPPKTLTSQVVFEDTTDGTTDKSCNVVLGAGAYYPEGAGASDFVACKYAVDGYEVLDVQDAALTLETSAGSATPTATYFPTYAYLKILAGGSGATLKTLRITGTATVKGDLNKAIVENVASPTKREAFAMNYLASATSAERLSRLRASWHKYACWTYKCRTNNLTIEPGDYLSFSDLEVLGRTATVRVVSVADGSNAKENSLELEAVSEVTAETVTHLYGAVSSANARPGNALSAAIAAQATATAATTSLAPAAIAQYNPAYTPELPNDPAGVNYQPTFATTDSWTGLTHNTMSALGGRLIATLSATAQLGSVRASLSFSGGKLWTFYFEEQYGDTYRFRATVGGVSTIIGDVAFTANVRKLVTLYIPSGTVTQILFANLTNSTRPAGSTAKLDTLYIGTGDSLSPTIDTSGNGNHLTNTAAVPVTFNGRKWWAFNGASSNLVATTAILGATGFISRRIRTPAAFTEQFICGNLSGNTGCALKIMAGGTLRLAVGNGSTVVNLDTTVAASTEYWIACYIGATSATLYKDGATADTDTVTMIASSTAWAEGKDPASAANYWKGYTSEPYATTILPTAAQIRDLYYNGPPAELYTPAMYRDDIIDDDGQISVEEKIPLKTRVLEIYNLVNATTALSTTSTTKDGDFSAITAEAIAAGLTAASAEVVLYVGAANAIRDFCWNSSTGVLNNMNAPSSVTAGALDELLSEYRTAYNGLKQAILNQRVTSSSTLDPIQSNGYHQVPVDSGGTPTTYVGTNNLIQVFEGITHLQATTGTPGNGQFKVVATGTNITAGAVSVSGLDAAVADASAITADAAYITFAITGKSSAGTAFSIYLSQTITKSRAGADAVVYSLATSVGTAKVNSAGAVSPSTVSATRYKKIGSASKSVTTDGTLKYKRSSDAGETATSNGTGISIAATDTYIDFFFYDASAVLDVTVRVPIIVDGLIADVATYAPRYLGVGLLAAADSATFRLDTVDSAGVITTGANTTAHVGDSMVNHDATNVALGIYVWDGSAWNITEDMARLSGVQTSIFALAQGGITIPGLAVVQTLMAQRLFAIETTIADTGWVKSANYAETGGYPTAGFMLDAVNEIIKAKGARFIDAEISGRFLGTNIYIKDDLMEIWSGASRLFPSVGDTKIMIALADVPGIDSFWSAFELYRCTTEGEWEYTGPVGIGTGGVRTPGPFYANRIHLGSITPSATMMKVVDDISNDYTSYRVDICGGYNIMQLTGKIRATLRVFWVYGSGWVTELDHEYFNTYPYPITPDIYIPLLTAGTTMTEWKANRLSTSQEMVVQVAMTFRSNIGLYGLNDVEFVEV